VLVDLYPAMNRVLAARVGAQGRSLDLGQCVVFCHYGPNMAHIAREDVHGTAVALFDWRLAKYSLDGRHSDVFMLAMRDMPVPALFQMITCRKLCPFETR
jgi:hypothetical protein